MTPDDDECVPNLVVSFSFLVAILSQLFFTCL